MSQNQSAMKRIAPTSVGLFVGLTAASIAAMNVATAATENVAAEVTFVTPVSLSEVNSLKFGLVDTSIGNTETLIVGTDDTLDGTGSSSVIGGTTEAAEVTVSSAASQGLSIQVNNITASSNSYYTLGSFTCSYNGATATNCSTSAINVTAPGSGSNSVALLIGATLTVASASISAGADNGSFDVVVAYQ